MMSYQALKRLGRTAEMDWTPCICGIWRHSSPIGPAIAGVNREESTAKAPAKKGKLEKSQATIHLCGLEGTYMGGVASGRDNVQW